MNGFPSLDTDSICFQQFASFLSLEIDHHSYSSRSCFMGFRGAELVICRDDIDQFRQI